MNLYLATRCPSGNIMVGKTSLEDLSKINESEKTVAILSEGDPMWMDADHKDYNRGVKEVFKGNSVLFSDEAFIELRQYVTEIVYGEGFSSARYVGGAVA